MYYSNLDKMQYLGDDIFVFVFLKQRLFMNAYL
jgi:hypothetical protein